MKHVSQSIPKFRVIKPGQKYGEEKCATCGNMVKFFESEYKKPCEKCGTWVFEKKRQATIQSKKIDCWVCLDKGIVEYPLQKNGHLYKHIARCSCPKGMNWPGTIPLLEQCQHAPKPEFVEYRNMETYKKVWDGRAEQ